MDSMSEGKTAFDLLGFNDATGKAVHTELRKAWERGGVFLCDELDAGSANVLACLNALLSQPIAAFPDGMIPKHEAVVFSAAGNTTGAGADTKFVGRTISVGTSTSTRETPLRRRHGSIRRRRRSGCWRSSRRRGSP